MLRFDDALSLSDDGHVDARGPLGPEDEVIELCAWVFQQHGGSRKAAAATEMGVLETHHGPEHGPGDHVHVIEDGGRRKWQLELAPVGNHPGRLEPGEAFGVAVAMFRDENGAAQVLWWGHPLTLRNARRRRAKGAAG